MELNEKAKSKTQQRLFGMVSAYNSGSLDLDGLPASLAKKIKGIADGQRKKTGDKRKFTKGIDKDKVKDYASTKHEELPEKVEECKKYPMSLSEFNKFCDSDKLNEEKMETERIIIDVRKGTGKHLADMLEYIKSTGNIGHSFSIIIDPEGDDFKKTFEWDGDGQDYIDSIKLDDDE